MAEDNQTPPDTEPTASAAPAEPTETPVEEGVEATPVAAEDVPAEAIADTPPAEAGPALPKKEQRAQARHVETSKRSPRTPEERNAERLAERVRKASARRRRREKARTARPTDRGPAKTVSTAEHGPGRPKVRQGLVVSDKADKTITVRVDTARRHRRYEKIVRSSSTLHAHDEANDAHEGDLVQIVESRPLSRLKRWRLVEVLERAK